MRANRSRGWATVLNHFIRVGRRPPPARARTVAAVVAAASLVLLTAACGSIPSSADSGTASSTGGSTSSQSTSSQQLAFASCMRSGGVPNFPDPSSGEFNKVTLARLANSNSRYQAASRACQHLLPTPSVTQQRDEAAQALLFSNCVRTHGVTNFPDPGSDGRIPDPASFGIDQGSPRFEAANQACGKYRPPYMPSNAAYNAYARTQAS